MAASLALNSPQLAPSDRRSRMRELVLRDGYVAVEELAELFGVSIMTVHRDLETLEDDGWLVKVRGGARIHPDARLDTTVRSRMETMPTEKRLIAEKALTHVEPGHVVLFDESTSALAMIKNISDRAPLTVITNFLAIMNRLSGQPGIDLISLGGTYHRDYDAFLGLLATETVSRLQADILFMSTTAVQDGFCFHKSQETVQLKLAAMEVAAKKVLLVDHAKFSGRALHRLCPITDFDLVIVDQGLDEKSLENLISTGVAVEVA